MRRLLEIGRLDFRYQPPFHQPLPSGPLRGAGIVSIQPEVSVVPAAAAAPDDYRGHGLSRAFFEGLKSAYEHWIELPPDRLTVVEMDTGAPDRRAFSSFSVSSMPVAHRPESLAFRITDAEGKVLVYSGDTDFCDSLATIADKADLMICESAFPDDRKVDGHLTPSLAGRIARTAGVKRLVLTHFYPDCEDADIENQCRSTYNGKLVLAQDLMTFGL